MIQTQTFVVKKILFFFLVSLASISCGNFKTVQILGTGEKANVGNLKLYQKGDTVIVYYKDAAYNWILLENWPGFEGHKTLSRGIWYYKAVVQ